ncbi:MAG: MBOAT family protein [Candidatus Zixiibacteriota bacterium]|nr:MAG: MBOAT family protein [candidate division Zixibacteria bacterium]
MLFNSFVFAIFFPLVFCFYWLLPFRAQNIFLLIASYIFYGYWDWRFLSLIAISTTVDYIAGINIDREHSRDDAGSMRRKKAWLAASVCTNLGILGFFKYFDFFIESFAGVLDAMHIPVDPLYLNVILPVGISFYTFQTMSYTIDVYRGKMTSTRRFFDFALYVAFFPQLVAGPIERARSLLPRILNCRTFNRSQFFEGLHLILLGLFKKVYVADNLGPLVDRVFMAANPTSFEVLFGGWAFAFQVYCDFSGYSDIARGCAKCLGIELMINFNHPYAAINPVERWRRWHISLSSWLRDYLYISLGGNRKGTLKTYRNLGLTMLLGGLWHGAAWNFVLWGAWEGLLLIGHRLLQPVFEAVTIFRRFVPDIIRRAFKILLLFQLVCFGLTIFRSQSVAHMWQLLGILFDAGGGVDHSLLKSLVQFVLPLTLFEALQYAVSRDEWARIERIPGYIRSVAYAILLYLFAFHAASAQSFIYFQF